MSDFEKNRAEYVTRLEAQVQNLHQQLNAIQADARWIPQVGGEVNDGQVRLTMSFGGKNQTAVLSYEFIKDHSVGDATTSILELAFQSLVNDRLREVIEPEVQRLRNNVLSISPASPQW